MYNSEESFYTAVTISALLLGIIIVYFILSMLRHQRLNVQRYKTKIKAEIETIENERKRIASDIHDELGPILSAVRLQINHLETPSASDEETITKVNKYIDDVIAKTREISYNLLPNTLVRKGLEAAVQEYINKISHIPLHISFSQEKEIRLTKEQDVNIYRIILEIINNTIKHADAAELHINLYKTKNKIVLDTFDNGRGYDYDAMIAAGKGLGLYNLQSRGDVLNARFTLSSVEGEGTYYSFEIPQVCVLKT